MAPSKLYDQVQPAPRPRPAAAASYSEYFVAVSRTAVVNRTEHPMAEAAFALMRRLRVAQRRRTRAEVATAVLVRVHRDGLERRQAKVFHQRFNADIHMQPKLFIALFQSEQRYWCSWLLRLRVPEHVGEQHSHTRSQLVDTAMHILGDAVDRSARRL